MPSTSNGHGDSAGRPDTRRPQLPLSHRDDGYFSLSRNGADGSKGRERRKATTIAVEHVLSPLIDTLPALPNLATLRTYLPTSPPPNAPPLYPTPERNTSVPTFSQWQKADLGDGCGRQNLLLVSAPDCALRMYQTTQSKIPEEAQVLEDVAAPEEIFSLSEIRRDTTTKYSALPGVDGTSGSKRSQEVVLRVKIVDSGDLVDNYGPVALVLLSKSVSGRNSGINDLSLIVLSLRTGLAIRESSLGRGRSGTLEVSSRAIAIAITDPTPSIHLLHPSTFQHLHTISDLPTPFPTFTLSGRLLAFVTDEAPRSIGSDGLGSIITARTTPRSRNTSAGPQPVSHPLSPSHSASGAIASAAVSIGGGVARGVWAGLKMGAQAAHQANAARLARSAPAQSALMDEDEGEVITESQSMDEGGEMDSLPAEGGSGRWIKIIDLGKRPESDVPTSPYEMGGRARNKTIPTIRTIAQFQLPHTRLQDYTSSLESRLPNASSSRTVISLSWNRDGTQLLAAPSDGRTFHIFQIHQGSPGAGRREIMGEALHLYELKRGTTAAKVQEVVWDEIGRWIGVATERGTIHVYPIHPSGAPANRATHTSVKIVNPPQRYPLSQIVEASVRLRSYPQPSSLNTEQSIDDHAVSFAVTGWQLNPLLSASFSQDIYVFRPSLQIIELQRLSILPSATVSPKTSVIKRGSGITEMMRLKMGSGVDGENGLAIEHVAKAKWRLNDMTELEIHIGAHVVPDTPGTSSSLAHAEIRTFSVNPRILPASIYLSHQFDFHSTINTTIRNNDDDRKRIVYRAEVQIKPGLKEAASFDEPLSTALNSRIESPTRGEIPGLPNGLPSAKWRSPIPIRTVAAGVGESLDRVRQNYVKAQAIRRRRRASEHESNRLSFEEGAVFASSLDTNRLGLDIGNDSSPSSEAMPGSDSAIDDTEWAEGWEDEYRRAVEVEGEPDDLVLGLMDEEEEERRREMQKIVDVGKKKGGEKVGRR